MRLSDGGNIKDLEKIFKSEKRVLSFVTKKKGRSSEVLKTTAEF